MKLSFNPECQPLLLSYLCLPKASSLLSLFARSPTAKPWVAEAVAVLIKNLASVSLNFDSYHKFSSKALRRVWQLTSTRNVIILRINNPLLLDMSVGLVVAEIIMIKVFIILPFLDRRTRQSTKGSRSRFYQDGIKFS